AYTTFGATIERARALLACDAQTSGGLLAALPKDRAHGIGTTIGRVRAGIAGRVTVCERETTGGTTARGIRGRPEDLDRV
ncbi:MAG TPA: hypothetical protein VGO31_01030, partial [Microbacteriaceae bacterium]|nr:hypothetical protein [Microbacteriaceae bacterium]